MKRHLALAGMVGAACVAYTWRNRQRAMDPPHFPVLAQAGESLTRALPIMCLPTSPDRIPELLPDGRGLRCPTTGRVYPYRDGMLDLFPHTAPPLTTIQQLLDTPVTAWAYDRFRNALLGLLGLPPFHEEVTLTQHHLQVQPGDVVLDLACGQGNFTVEWARRAGGDGLVIGLDISIPMLRRAVARIMHAQLSNVLLVRGDAQALPVANGSVGKINCSGGFHQLPDLPQALREMARVSMPGAVLTASTFAEGPHDRNAPVKRWLQRRLALHFVSLEWLETHLAAADFQNYHAVLPGGWFGYISARKAA